ncbi:type 1 periplasmic binding fold superfamily protein [Portibacter marinus]|uniref:type 1 periplasmic binding fold superfamily protein n=1 Tax=Portibacter marinus TaxID=2898660 RepID=UPI001F1C6C3F|nr:type 1 periplasmic binding fold superfamily protein [Portibacter marinus]
MIQKIALYTILLTPFLLSVSCEKEEPVIPNEEELITTVNLTLTPAGNGIPVQFTFVDIDGDGGEEPTITGGTLMANQTYFGELELLNEAETPAEDITQEIQEEAEEHQFFFQSEIEDLEFVYIDQDENGFPIGLNTRISTGNPDTGQIIITLKHEPNKAGDGVSDGNLLNAGGETDIEIRFPVTIQ